MSDKEYMEIIKTMLKAARKEVADTQDYMHTESIFGGVVGVATATGEAKAAERISRRLFKIAQPALEDTK